MRACVAPTDFDWYRTLLATPDLAEVNFWRPSGQTFRALEQGDPFFFKLKAKHGHKVVGFGFFARYSRLPAWMAWDCFGRANGASSFEELRGRILRLRERNRVAPDPELHIGCILLTQPTLFPLEEAVLGPSDWKPRTQGYKTYHADSGEGLRVWLDCLERIERMSAPSLPAAARRAQRLVDVRFGQGTFKSAVLDAYERHCAVTGEHSLPVLEAAHIIPYAETREHRVSNGLLLRRDVHALFDRGFCTVDADLRFVVSSQLASRWDNGRTYYELHGRPLHVPRAATERPDPAALAWHRSEVFVP